MRGQLSSATIVGLVLGIAGFLMVGLLLLGVFDTEELTQRELCKLSILSRATAPNVATDAIPLNCYTEKICITVKKSLFDFRNPSAILGGKDESDCRQFAGEDNVRTVEVVMNNDPQDQAETLATIEREQANAMYDCWVMTGEGKLDVFRGTTSGGVARVSTILTDLAGADGLSGVIRDIKPQCLVCSRVAISDAVYEADGKYMFLRRLNLNEYLRTQLVPGSSLTYLQTFTDPSVRSYAGIERINTLDNKYAAPSLPDDQTAIIFMQIKTDQTPDEVGAEAALLTGTAIGGGGLLTGIGRRAITKLPLVSLVTSLVATGGAYLAARSVQEDNQAISFAACNAYTSRPDAKLGCSLIKPVLWDATAVNSLCAGGIEGNL